MPSIKLDDMQMTNNTIYTFLLHQLLAPLCGMADSPESVDEFRSYSPDDAIQMKSMIRQYLLPHYAHLNSAERRYSKLCLMYYLSKPDSHFDRVLDSQLLPLASPKNARDFFVWMWEVFFGQESYQLQHLDQYVVDNRLDVTYGFGRPEEDVD